MSEQFYLFTSGDDSMCPVWCEWYDGNGGHTVAPTPHSSEQDAYEWLRGQYPGATVDTLWLPQDIAQCREWARTMPLEQIPA